jgi:hypothetical protein
MVTPFGILESDEGKQRAPTAYEVASNPSKYWRTSYDPVLTTIPVSPRMSEFLDLDGGVPEIFWKLFRLDRSKAQSYAELRYGVPLNLAALSEEQKILLGI